MTDLQQNRTNDMMIKTIKNTLIASLPFLVMACGSGTETQQNIFTGSGPITTAYSGPAPRDADVNDFMNSVWVGLKSEARCGQCHDSDGGQVPFVDETDVNNAYDNAMTYIDLNNPTGSVMVTKVGGGHSCWITGQDAVCAETIENMIVNWAGGSNNTTARAIPLEAPAVIRSLEDVKNYPEFANTDPDINDAEDTSFEQTIYPLLTQYCSACHYEEGAIQVQQPFFANPDDAESAYGYAKTKINIDEPANSRFVDRLLDGHQCWTGPSPAECALDAEEMRLEIAAFADSIPTETVNPLLVTSKAAKLLDDGIVASGGNRHESDVIALYEFKAGSGSKAYDTSGIGEAMDLTLTGSVSWLGAYGLDFAGGKAQASIGSSTKLFDLIQISQSYSIETWVIPDNVTQEEANIIGYDVGPNQKNFALSQTLYNYNFANRTDQSDAAGEEFISSEDAGEILQSSLQHVVVTYDNIEGRQIFVNGELLREADTPNPIDDPVNGSTSISNWDTTMAFVLGQNANNGQTWEGKIRMVAIHNEVLTPEQVLQNFDVGVGQKYYLLFSVSEELDPRIDSCFDPGPDLVETDDDIHNCFIKFEVSQFDEYGYLFLEPTFINLDTNWTPADFTIENLRVGINGKEAVAGQAFATMSAVVSTSNGYTTAEGQMLSTRGTVIALEKGAGADVFFLTFEVLGDETFDYVDISPVIPSDPADADAVPEIGVRTFDEINQTISTMTGIPMTNSAVSSVFQQYRQQLPAVENIDSFLSSHQMAIAQLALTYCSERVEIDAALSTGDTNRGMFVDFNFGQNAPIAFDDPGEKSNAINPVLDAVLLSGLDPASEEVMPDRTEVADLLGSDSPQTLVGDAGNYSYDSLITEMLSCPVPGDPHFKDDPNIPGIQALFPCDYNTDIDSEGRTKEIVKAICAAAVGSAAMLIQ